MQGNINHMVIRVFICVALISLGISFSIRAKEGEPLEEESKAPTYEELVEKVRAQEKRIIRLELIIGLFKISGVELNDPTFEAEIDAAVAEIVDAEPEKPNIVGIGFLMGSIILLAVGFAVLIFKLSRR